MKMNKQEFLAALRQRLSALSDREVEERLSFYSEMIDDGMEEGRSEEEAVAAVGSVENVAAGILADVIPTPRAPRRVGVKRQRRAWETVLLAVGSPVWLSLLIAALAVVVALYASLWAVLVSIWAVFGAFIGSALWGVLGGVVTVCLANIPTGLALIGAGCVCAGLSILTFFGCRAATRGTLLLTRRLVAGVKNACRKEAV